MKFSLNWLQEMVSLPSDIKALTHLLSVSGFEVDAILPIGHKLSSISIVQIEDIQPHPNADKLVVTQVYDGKNRYQIVTGAKNMGLSDKVPCSLPGAILSNGTVIKEAKLRGVSSFGMLCSQYELGIDTQEEGLWILPQETELGHDAIEKLGLKDTLLEIAILPNRGDCLSHYGLARELSALLQLPLKLPPTSFSLSSLKPQKHFEIDNQATSLCHVYKGALLSGISPISSPIWMQLRLSRCGIRPIQLAVDITNYVLLELGQPLHAFDADTLENETISIHLAAPTDTLETLDKQARALTSTDLVISNHTPIALAGIMGGLHTQVQNNTSTIFLEAAHFDAMSIRKTGSRLGLKSESQVRFEKQVDPSTVQTGLNRALHLFQTLMSANILANYKGYEKKDSLSTIPYTSEAINTLLGSQFSEFDIANSLARLHIVCKNNIAIIPSFRRHDIQTMSCLAEEMLRLHGLDIIPERPTQDIVIQEPVPFSWQKENLLIDQLTSLGYCQILTFPMVSKLDSPDSCLRISNPLTPEESVMRTSLLPSLLKVAQFNQHRQQENIAIFEMGPVFQKTLPQFQDIHCGLLLSTHDFFALKELLTLFLPHPVIKTESLPPFLHPNQSVLVYQNETFIGYCGMLHPKILSEANVIGPMGYLEMSIHALEKPQIAHYTPFSIYPSTRRDMALVMPKTLSFKDIQTLIDSHKNTYLKDYYVFDLFESEEKLGQNNKSMAIAFIYQSETETLQVNQVNDYHEKLYTILKNELSLSLRI